MRVHTGKLKKRIQGKKLFVIKIILFVFVGEKPYGEFEVN